MKSIEESIADAAAKRHPESASHATALEQECFCIVNRKRMIADSVRFEIEGHKNVLEVYDAMLREEQSKCPHIVTEHHRDPAGGSSSFTECLICGGEV